MTRSGEFLWQCEAIFYSELCGQRLCLFSGEDDGHMDRKGHEKRIVSKTCLVASVASETNFSITLANMSSGVGRKGVKMAESVIGSRMPASNARRFLLGPSQNKNY